MNENFEQKKNEALNKTDVMRSIRVYSNPIDERLDYTKKYVFHHWTTKRKALIEVVENGYLMEVEYEGNFNFKVD